MIDEILQRLGGTSAGKMADEALSSVDWNALHERSQSTFDRVRNGGSLALVDSPMPAQALASARRPKPPSAFDRAYAEMMDTVQHIKNAGGGFGLNVNQPALDAWVADGPLSPNIEDRRKENTVRSKTELRTNLTKQLRFADLGNGEPPNPPVDFPALAALSGMQQAPPVDPAQAAMDRYKQYIPPQQARGPVETIKDAFSLQKDEQGNPQAPRALDYINAALMALPGARGGPVLAAEKGAGGGGGIRAYHASPHDFEKFDMSKVGTGLGHAYRGEGMNFTTNEAKALAMREQYFPGGHVYETNLRVSPEELLNFDKPIAEQPHVQRALDSAGVVPGGNLPAFARKNLTGKDALAAMENQETPAWRKVLNDPMVSTSQQGTRQHLLKSGIPGGVSGDQHVIYNDALIDILRKYGIVGGVLGGGAVAATNNEAKAQ